MRAFPTIVLLAGLLAPVAGAGAIDLKSLKEKLGGSQAKETASESSTSGSNLLGNLASGLSLPEIGTDTAGNAAGVLQYCIRHKYLDGDVATTVKNRLLSSVGLEEDKAEEDTDYRNGLSGLLQGNDGNSFNLDSISDKVKDKACDYVLDNAGQLI